MSISVAESPRAGIRLTPLTRRRFANFVANRRGFWSLWLFLALFVISLLAELVANDKPLVVSYEGHWYYPVFVDYPETTFGGDFPSEADYRDAFVRKQIAENGWALWPLIPFSYKTINYDLTVPAPS